MYSDDPIGNKPDTAQGGQTTPNPLAGYENALRQFEAFVNKHPFITALTLAAVVTVCGAVMVYRFIYDQFNDFNVNVSGDFERNLIGDGNWGGSVMLWADNHENVIIRFPDDLPPELGRHEFGPISRDYQLEVSLNTKNGNEFIFPPDSVVSGYVILKNIPDDCYEEIRGSFQAVMKSGTFEIEVKGNFDFDPYVYYEDDGDIVPCELPFAW